MIDRQVMDRASLNETNIIDEKHFQETAIQWRVRMLVVAQTIGLVAMMGVTYRLWIPFIESSVESEVRFPAIPVFSFLSGIGPLLGWVVSGGLVLFSILGCFCLVTARLTHARLVFCVVILTLTGGVLLNQHRFLPWVWQSLIIYVGYCLLSGKDFLRFSRVLIVSIYIYSAISKLDYQFVKSTGREIFQALTSLLQVDTSNWPGFMVDWIVLGFPVAELMIGIGLLAASTRLFAMFGGMGMHLALLAALGPWGLKNAESVLLWNILFIVQLSLIYWPTRSLRCNASDDGSAVEEKTNQREFADQGRKSSIPFAIMASIVCVFPLLEKINCLDHWPAWALYSPQSSRCRLYVPDWKVEQLPDEIQKLFGPPNKDRAMMREFQMGLWSLKELNAPIYPQDRFQFGVAKYLVERMKLERSFEIVVQSASHFWNGKRVSQPTANFEKLEFIARKSFWGNTNASFSRPAD